MARKGAGRFGGGGGGGNLLFSNLILLVCLALSAIGWLVAFIGQAAAESNAGHQGVLWFAIFLQLFLLIAIAFVIMRDSVASASLQVSAFLAVALVFAVFGINEGIYAGQSSLNAVAAGWFILTIVDIILLLYFTSSEDTMVYRSLTSFGNGQLSGPGERGRGMGLSGGGSGSMAHNGGGYSSGGAGGGGVFQPSGSMQGIGNGNGYQSAYGNVGSSHDLAGNGSLTHVQGGNVSKPSGLGGGVGSIRSANTHNAGGYGAAGGVLGGSVAGGPKSDISHGADQANSLQARTASPVSASKHNNGTTVDGHGQDPMPGYGYRAKALYAYQANADDPTEISFSKGEILDIVDNSGKWWQARKSNGETGIVPSNYMTVL